MTKHAKGFKVYARNDQTIPHRAVRSFMRDGVWHCACGYPVVGEAEAAL